MFKKRINDVVEDMILDFIHDEYRATVLYNKYGDNFVDFLKNEIYFELLKIDSRDAYYSNTIQTAAYYKFFDDISAKWKKEYKGYKKTEEEELLSDEGFYYGVKLVILELIFIKKFHKEMDLFSYRDVINSISEKLDLEDYIKFKTQQMY